MFKGFFGKPELVKTSDKERINDAVLQLGLVWIGSSTLSAISSADKERLKKQLQVFGYKGRHDANINALIDTDRIKRRFVIFKSGIMWRLLLWNGTLSHGYPPDLDDGDGLSFHKNDVKDYYINVDVFIPNGGFSRTFRIVFEDIGGKVFGKPNEETKLATTEEVIININELKALVSNLLNQNPLL